MRIFLPLLFILVSCSNNKHEIPQVTQESRPSSKQDTVSIVVARQADTMDIYKFGQAVIDGNMEVTVDHRSWMCLDSLTSKNEQTRQFFFKVYKAISLKCDGALSEVIGSRIKNYFITYPNECLSNFKLMSDKEQKAFSEFIAFEFYASGKYSEKQIADYFKEIASQFVSGSDKQTLANMQSVVLNRAKQLYQDYD